MSLASALRNLSLRAGVAAITPFNTAAVLTTPVRNMGTKKLNPNRPPRKQTVYYIKNGKILTGTQIPKKRTTTQRLLAKSEQITVIKIRPSMVHPRNSVRDILLRFRLRHWDENRIANPHLNIPEQIPYDIDKQKQWWPAFHTYVKDRIILYRLAWKKYPEPSYFHITSVSDTPKNTIVRGVMTWRGITENRERVLTSLRKSDWRILHPEAGHCTFEVWEDVVRGGKEFFLPRPPCFDKSLAPAYEAEMKAKIDKVVESTKSKILN